MATTKRGGGNAAPRTDQWGYPMRKVVGDRRTRVQTYRVWVTLECGHTTSYTVSAKAMDEGRAKHFQTTGCFQCGIVPGFVPKWARQKSD